jgi:uncharacterized phage-associated protein
MPLSFTSNQINKIGNAMVYLTERVSEPNKTKLLKLLFLLEEASIKKYGVPFFGVDFQLWVRGPVLKDVFIDLSEERNPILFKNFIRRSKADDKVFEPVAEFCDDEFSDNDVELLEKIVQFAKYKTAKDFVNITHDENSLWRKSAIKRNVYEELRSEKIKSTDYLVDFSLLFEEDDYLKEMYRNSTENLEFKKRLKK